jgi:hypothetical protein
VDPSRASDDLRDGYREVTDVRPDVDEDVTLRENIGEEG